MEYIKPGPTRPGCGLSGDPSPVTAFGVYVGIKAAARVRWEVTGWQVERPRYRGAEMSPHTSAAISMEMGPS